MPPMHACPRLRRHATLIGVVVGLAISIGGCGKSRVEAAPVDAAMDPGVADGVDAAAADPPVDEVEEQRRSRAAKEAMLAALEAGDKPCVLPLAEFCAGKCPTYATAWAAAMKDSAATVPCSIGGVETGDCGAYRVVRWAGGYGGDTQYFSADGQLVGARRSTDYAAFCDHTHLSATYGVVPTCTTKVTKKLCAKDPSRGKCQQGDPLCVPP